MPILLGAIADDFTGATDLCSMLVRNGMRAVQLIGVPEAGLVLPDTDAVVIALKSRTAPVEEAVARSLAALDWLGRQGARQFLFKYCSTFDSTEKGNIGPVADALMDALGCDFTIACPAFPETGRTIFKGHLFVGDLLLSDTHMRHHPLTPMTDANLVRVLQRQTRRKVGLVPFDVVRQGPDAIRARFVHLRAEGCGYAITDAILDEDLRRLGAACSDATLITGGSGIAMGLPENFRRAGLLRATAAADALPSIRGPEAVLAGSCSAATLDQIEAFQEVRPALRLDPLRLADGFDPAEAVAWARARTGEGPVLIYASAPPEQVRAIQDRLGREQAGTLVETAMAAIARGLVEAGVRRLVVAGGETSGAVVEALGVKGLVIGPVIDPGVPATVSIGREPPLALALKSGNFGARDFFTKAFRVMP
ncbi:3-oxo-tetronate kinase [Benzoatithermus flavus]|uniref:3-oxo-tetronate kinase n=1 Tax=Benzoatithermus flavus TaxID=3108223 RepID=A0ABU8XVD5_9PROT